MHNKPEMFTKLYRHYLFQLVFFYVQSGRIDASEIQQSLGELGIDISKEDAQKILQRSGLHF